MEGIEEATGISVQSPTGATVISNYLRREIPVYGIQEHEVEMLSTLTTQSSAYFSLASFIFALASAPVFNAIFTDKLSDVAKLACYYFAPVGFVMAFVFLILGIIAVRTGASTWTRIKNQSRPFIPR